MLEALTSIKANSSDNISTVICVKCQLNLKLAYNIQQNMIKANEKLIGRHIIKQETYSIELNEVMIKEEKNAEDNLKDFIQLCNNHCFICGLITDRKSINNHMEQHFNQEQNCDLCDKSFCNIQSYRKHLMYHPEPSVLHHCKKCGASFQYRSLYYMHLEMVHKRALIAGLIPKPASYSCDMCSKTFTSKGTYAAHKANHKRKQCPICHKELARGSLRQHIEDHNDSPQICEFCGATLKNKSCLRMHLRYSHNKSTFKCDECGKVFKKKVSCNFHQKSAHGEPTHICDTCGKKFFSANRLNIHMKMTHMKLRPYVCEFCNRGFSSKFALTTHRRQHTNETPYRCDVCGEGFRQNVSLKGHRKSKHNIEEPKTCECK
ncbi:hypothetical protein BDFB_001415, partial [Asbolus verrucosus]